MAGPLCREMLCDRRESSRTATKWTSLLKWTLSPWWNQDCFLLAQTLPNMPPRNVGARLVQEKREEKSHRCVGGSRLIQHDFTHFPRLNNEKCWAQKLFPQVFTKAQNWWQAFLYNRLFILSVILEFHSTHQYEFPEFCMVFHLTHWKTFLR